MKRIGKRSGRCARALRALAIALALVALAAATAGLFSVETGAATTGLAESDFPVAVPRSSATDLAACNVNVVESFADGYSTVDFTAPTSEGTNDQVSSAEINGSLKMVPTGARAQVRLTYTPTKDEAGVGSSIRIEKGSAGLLFHVNASNTTVKSGASSLGFELSFGNYSNEPDSGWNIETESSDGSRSVKFGPDQTPLYDGRIRCIAANDKNTTVAYYCPWGTSSWTQSTNIDGGRIAVPAKFNGWIYIPFDQFRPEGDDYTKFGLADVLENYDVFINSFWFYTCNVGSTNAIFMDDICTVEFCGTGDDYIESAQPTVLPDGRGLTVVGDEIVDYSLPSKSDYEYSKFEYNTSQDLNSWVRTAPDAVGSNTGDPVVGFTNIAPGLSNPQQYLYNQSGVTVPSGATGVMYYLNLTDLKGNAAGIYDEWYETYDYSETSYLAFGVRLLAGQNGDAAGSSRTDPEYKANGKVAYYYTNGQWYKTNAVEHDRFAFPEGFEGYVYVPLESYISDMGASYGQALKAGDTLRGIFLLSGYVRSNEALNARNDIYVGELRFVSASGKAADNTPEPAPAYLYDETPDSVGNYSYEKTSLYDFEGDQGAYESHANSSSRFAWNQMKRCDFVMKTDAEKNDTELVIDFAVGHGQLHIVTTSPRGIPISDLASENGGIMYHISLSGMTGDRAQISVKAADGKTYTMDSVLAFTPLLYLSPDPSEHDAETVEVFETDVLDRNGDDVDDDDDFNVTAYYAADGADGWKPTTNIHASRIALPQDFSGWVYIPFSSYHLRSGLRCWDQSEKASRYERGTGIGEFYSDENNLLDSYLGGKSTIYLTGIRFYTDGNDPIATQAAQAILDDFTLVTKVADRINVEGSTAAATELIANMSVYDGANIRMADEENGISAGIRFKAEVDKVGNTAYLQLFPEGFDVLNNLIDEEKVKNGELQIEIGMLVVPEDYVGRGWNPQTNKSVLKVPLRRVYDETEDRMVFVATVTDVPYAWYGTNLHVKAYVLYVSSANYRIDLTGSYEFSYMTVGKNGTDTAVARSYSDVASAAYQIAENREGTVGDALKKIIQLPTTMPGTSSDISSIIRADDFEYNHGSLTPHKNGKGTLGLVEHDGSQMLKIYDGDYTGVGSYTEGSQTVEHTHNQLEAGEIWLNQYIDITGYSGLLFYVDFSEGVCRQYQTAGVYNTGGQQYSSSVPYNKATDAAYAEGDYYYLGVPLQLAYDNAGTSSREVRSYSATSAPGYYYEYNSSTHKYEWKTAYAYKSSGMENDNSGGYRIRLPKGFVGYVYIPFKAYVDSDDRTTTLSNMISGSHTISGVSGQKYRYLMYMPVYCNCINQDSALYLDNFCVIK